MIVLSRLAKAAFEILPDSISLPIQGGRLKGLKWIPKAANPGQLLGRYEPVQEFELAQLLTTSKVFWDVGAHVGWYSLLAHKKMPEGGQICTFEPHPDNIRYLEQHIELNQIANIRLFKVAISSNIGECLFSGQKQQGQLSDTGEISVKTTTADTVVQNLKQAPDLLKVDIEGGEVEFLEGAQTLLRTHRPTIVLSTHGYQKRDACLEHLKKLGYSFRHIAANKPDGDYVFIATPA